MQDKKLSGFKKLFAPIDMTVGIPGKQIIAFAIPMLIGNIAQQLYKDRKSTRLNSSHMA